ncbi:hypothetical protein AVEN_2106-1 [Araneus ventricosus]|uniref:Uncharacterized protein n=1 Tax=Araneus ventricosus TaxID=182803 RepID=A0A4Y2JEH9_ARAVE|nr:hypothetical protein AVEN_2106-1 [Araneus ventricosus]
MFLSSTFPSSWSGQWWRWVGDQSGAWKQERWTDEAMNTQKCPIWRTTSPSCACSSTVSLSIQITLLYGAVLLMISFLVPFSSRTFLMAVKGVP